MTSASNNSMEVVKPTLRQTCPRSRTSGASCVQRFDGSRNSAIHTTYRISLRSSSIREPRYPLLRVVSGWRVAHMGRHARVILQAWVVWAGVAGCVQRVTGRATGDSRPPGRYQTSHTLQQRGGVLNQSLLVSMCINDPSAGSPTETLLRLLLPLSGRV